MSAEPADGPLLAGVTVLDLGTVGPGARACRVLADYGAAVTRVLPVEAGSRWRLPFYAYGADRGIRRCGLDLRSADGRAVALDLARGCDVVVEGFRPGVADRLGLGHRDVAAVHPRVVYCSATGYGATGPLAGRAGHDLDYLALTGYLHCGERTDGGRPTLPGLTLADAAGGGLHAALAVLAALVHRDRTGHGRHLDVAATDGMLGMMAMHLDEYLATGVEPGPGHGVLTGRYACYGVYGCADGGWLAVATVEPAFFAALCAALGRPELAALQYDDGAQESLRAALADTFRTRGRDEWVRALADVDACVAPVLSIAEVAAHEQFRARSAYLPAEHPSRGRFDQVGAVWAGATAPGPVAQLADDDTTDTDALLRGLGYPAERIADLRSRRVVR